MALTTCRECGKQVSTEAKTCPNCGVAAPVKSGISLGAAAAVALLGAAVIAWNIRLSDPPSTPVAAKSPEEIKRQQAADETRNKPDLPANMAIALAKATRNGAKNPDSVKFELVTYIAKKGGADGEGAYCFSFRGTNSFNAIVPEHVAYFVTGDTTKAAPWNSACGGKSGRDLGAAVRFFE